MTNEQKFWRMQLHPDDKRYSFEHAVRSLAAGYIGLGFRDEPGDLTKINSKEELKKISKDQGQYLPFCNEMQIGDIVLVISHHYPVALCEVTGHYNYVKEQSEEIGVWFNHFRGIEVLSYAADYETDLKKLKSLKMTDTIIQLKNEEKENWIFIREWLKSLGYKGPAKKKD